MSKKLGKISEVFASIQGEGRRVGSMQLFVRTLGCNIKCRRCDVQKHLLPNDSFTVKPWLGQRIKRMQNPITAEKLFTEISKAYPLKQFYSVSFTGGEPLLQTDFLYELLPYFKKEDIPIFIETNGTMYKEFEILKPLVTYWSVDLKLSQTWGLNTDAIMKKHAKILESLNPENSYIRMTLDTYDDPEFIINKIKHLDLKKYSLVIQPFTKAPSHINDWDTNNILEWISLLSPFFLDVRWIPQVHKLLRIP